MAEKALSKIEIIGDAPKKGRAVALGNFDGVHLGHRAVFDAARAHGKWSVASFTPHPRRFFDPDGERFELMNERTQARLIKAMGGDFSQIRFDAKLAGSSPEDFLEAFALTFEPKAIITGADFRFGKARAGDAAMIESWAKAKGLSYEAVNTVKLEGERISSSAIRSALHQGQPEIAAKMLGRPHIMNGIVAKGDQRGRDLGFPTANLYPKNTMLPKFGIYATRLTIHDGDYAGRYMAASSLGVRPSFGVNKPNFESHILDFDGDIYGAEISVELIEYIRPELKFDDIDALITQMHQDVVECRRVLNA